MMLFMGTAADRTGDRGPVEGPGLSRATGLDAVKHRHRGDRGPGARQQLTAEDRWRALHLLGDLVQSYASPDHGRANAAEDQRGGERAHRGPPPLDGQLPEHLGLLLDKRQCVPEEPVVALHFEQTLEGPGQRPYLLE